MGKSYWRDLSLRRQLQLGFALMLALLAAVGALGLIGLQRLQSHIDQMVEQRYPQMGRVVALERELLDMGRSLRNLLLWTDLRDVRRESERVRVQRERLEANLAGLAALPQARRLEQGGQQYLRLQRRFDDLVTAGSSDDGRDLLKSALMPAEAEFQAAVQELLVEEGRGVAAAARATAATSGLLRGAIAAAVAVALVLAVALAAWLVRLATRPLRLAMALADTVAGGDLSQPISAEGRNEAAQLLRSLAGMQQALVSLVGEVRGNAQQLAGASSAMAEGNQDLSARTEQQAGALQQIGAAMGELAGTVARNAREAAQAHGLADEARGVAERGAALAETLQQTMSGISDSARQVAEITGVIEGIAFQTNILALNAAVEAARAGEQGRGFAVVAAEVRALAGRSAEAARSIGSLIAQSEQRVAQGAAQVQDSAAAMQQLRVAVGRLNTLMAGISRDSSAQSACVGEVGQALSHIDHNTQRNAALVGQSASAALALQQQARQLLEAVARFRLQPESFTSSFTHERDR